MDFHLPFAVPGKLDNLIFLDSQSVSIFRFYHVQETIAGVDVEMLASQDH